MIGQLAQCPYCQGCEIALDDSPQLVFNPDAGNSDPCPHLVKVEARYSQWGRSPQGVSRVIGSTDCCWDHPALDAADYDGHLKDYLTELVNAGRAWEFAPSSDFEVCRLSRDEKQRDARGHEQPIWEVDGEALFARDATVFLAELPGCQEQHLAASRVEPPDEAS